MYAWIEELRFPRRRTTRPSLKQAKKWCLQLRLIVLTSTRLRTICLAGVYRFVVDENLSLAGSKRGPIRTLLASWRFHSKLTCSSPTRGSPITICWEKTSDLSGTLSGLLASRIYYCQELLHRAVEETETDRSHWYQYGVEGTSGYKACFM